MKRKKKTQHKVCSQEITKNLSVAEQQETYRSQNGVERSVRTVTENALNARSRNVCQFSC